MQITTGTGWNQSGLWTLTQRKGCSVSLTAIIYVCSLDHEPRVGIHFCIPRQPQDWRRSGILHTIKGTHYSETAEYCLTEIRTQRHQVFSFKRWHSSSFVGNLLVFKILAQIKIKPKQCVTWDIRTCLWTASGPICCSLASVQHMTLNFTLLTTHSVYVRQGYKWLWEPEILLKGTPVNDWPQPFQQVLFTRAQKPASASRTSLHSQKAGTQWEQNLSLCFIFVAIVKKKIPC